MDSRVRLRIIVAGSIGNLLEWYDFAIYGYFAAQIGRAFFPQADAVAQVLAAFGIFAAGYLMRPLGGVLIGHIGDRYGRQRALVFSITAMAVPTILVGILPGYLTLGEAAPALLTFLRMIQGLSVGGEWTTSFTYLVEHAPPGRRGLLSAIACCGGMLGTLAGSATGAVLASVLSPEALDSWGWRLPFLFGFVVAIAGYLLRRRSVGVAEIAGMSGGLPLAETLRHHFRLVVRLAGVTTFLAVGFYLVFLYMVSWLQSVDGVDPARALTINTASMMTMIPIALAAGWLSDRIGGRPPVMLAAMAAAMVGAVPLFLLMHQNATLPIATGQIAFVILVGTVSALTPAFMVEATPPSVRCTAIALGYNIPNGLFGGMTPLAAAWLVERTDVDLSPAFMMIAAAAISFATLWTFRRPLAQGSQ
jgi:MHS family proline/betaine transporter-like MFS transporter